MERNNALLRALFAWVEPIVIGLVTGRQWLVLLGLCNIFVIMLIHNSEKQKTPFHGYMFGYQKQLQHLRAQNNYFGAFAFVAILMWLIWFILENGDQYAKIALGLMAAWVSYRVIAAATHGLKHTRTQLLSKIFALLVIVWAWRAYIGSAAWQTFFTDLPKNIKELFTIPTALAPSATTPVKVLGWEKTDTKTWAMNESGSASPSIPEGNRETPVQPTTNNSDTSPKDATTALTFSQVVPTLVKKFNLAVPAWTITFANIPSSNPLYNDFKAWYAARFFGPAINPNATVSCNVYFVMLWLAQKRDVTYNSTNIFTAFRDAAATRNQLYWCEAGNNVTAANLPN